MTDLTSPGDGNLACVMRRCRWLFLSAAFFSGVVNLLMLTGPLFMLLIYDRVLTSRSEETLVALVLLTGFLFAMMALLDIARSRIMTRAAARVQSRLDRALFKSALSGRTAAERARSAGALRDVDTVQRALSMPVVLSAMDLPWVPVFLGAVFLLHPDLGWLATAGGGLLVALAWLARAVSRDASAASASAADSAAALVAGLAEQSDAVRALGMADAATGRWAVFRARALAAAVQFSDTAATFGAVSRSARLFLQSAILALGAWLHLRGEVGAGALAASSVLLGRALAPVEGLLAGWQAAGSAVAAYGRLRSLPPLAPAPPRAAPPRRPRATLDVGSLVVAPGAGGPVLRLPPFSVGPGQLLGLIGPSGAGKSCLLRALAGVLPAAGGDIRLDGASVGQHDPSALGYLPQQVSLLPGTVADNIARLDPAPDAAAIVAAARTVGAHRAILSLPNGYETGCGGETHLSGGQAQLVCLARALYGNPVLLLLDEPDNGLDAQARAALIAALRRHCASGGAAIVATHRRALIRECNLLLALAPAGGHAFGPRDDVLASLAARTSALRAAPLAQGAA